MTAELEVVVAPAKGGEKALGVVRPLRANDDETLPPREFSLEGAEG